MSEENTTTTTMNLDLNLGPVGHSSDDSEPSAGPYPNVAMNREDWMDNPVQVRGLVRQHNRRWRTLWRHITLPPETRNLALELIGGTPEAGEGSNNAASYVVDGGDDSSGKKKDDSKNNTDDGGFFYCNICLDLAKDPVVTCCGHLFCWPCLYRWLQYHSVAKECPVCKGEVTMKNVTPIYGRGNMNMNMSSSNGTSACQAESNPSLKIPLRPQARRVESWRQAIQRSAFTIPMEEMIRRLGSELPSTHSRSLDGANRRNTNLLNRILTSRGMRSEQSPLVALPDDERDITANDNTPNHNNINIVVSNGNNNNGSRMSSSHRAAESLAAVESYFNSGHVERNQELPLPPVDDRDSVSSIAAVIHSESQTVDNAIEIDSTVSSSRRRYDASRISDVDSGDSRAPRRRRRVN